VTARTVGVEEELLLVDPATGQARAVAAAVIQAAEEAEEPAARAYNDQDDDDQDQGWRDDGDDPAEELEFELKLEQLETGTRPCVSLDDLGREIRRCRTLAAEAAGRVGVQVAAVGTSPMAVEPSLTRLSRYRRMAAEFGLTAQEQLTCGCHVHVQISSAEEGIAVLDRIRPWLPPLIALSANSPFWQGQDTGYASFRYQAWGRWPSAGPTNLFGSPQAYDEVTQAMVDTGTVLDQGMIYFDARLSRHYPTVEIRVADVCLHPDDAVLIAALVRSLVETAARNWQRGEPASPVRTELLGLASWRASRSALEDQLVDPVTLRPAAAHAVAYQLLEHLRAALEDAGDFGTATGLLGELLARGNGARVQRQAYQRANQARDVVRAAIARTLPW
jgi:YbdK family carboxylate-amine ligase